MKKSHNHNSLPLVSVIMTAYNQEKYITDAIKGVVKQKGPFRLELIIMNDCSTDSTGSIAKKWQERYPEIIKVYDNPSNVGYQLNYLNALKNVKGDYLAICDADDYWFDKNKVAKQVQYMETHPDCAITFHRVVNYYENLHEMSLSNSGQKTECTIEDLSKSNFITNMSVMYRKNLITLDDLPISLQKVISIDYAISLLYAQYGTIHYIKKPMGVYRKIQTGIFSTADSFKKLEMSIHVRAIMLNELRHIPEAVVGLRMAAQNILNSMNHIAANESQLLTVDKWASEFGLNVQSIQVRKKSIIKPLLSRIRATISKAIPVPKP